MGTYLLVPGAGGMSWYWHLVEQHLRAAGHATIALELPADDPRAGLSTYIEIAMATARGQSDLTVAAQSMGAFTAVPLCAHIEAQRLVLLNAMVPAPGETANDWWANTGSQEARTAAARAERYSETFDLDTYFLHDLSPELVAEGLNHVRDEANVAFEEPCPFTTWPDVPTTVLAGTADRFFPFAFQQRVAHERLGLEAQPVPGGHLNALSEPAAVAHALL